MYPSDITDSTQGAFDEIVPEETTSSHALEETSPQSTGPYQYSNQAPIKEISPEQVLQVANTFSDSIGQYATDQHEGSGYLSEKKGIELSQASGSKRPREDEGDDGVASGKGEIRLNPAEVPLAAYSMARTALGVPLGSESIAQLRNANTAVGKTKQLLSSGAGNIQRTEPTEEVEALQRTNGIRTLSAALSKSLNDPNSEFGKCWPREALGDITQNMNDDEASELLNHVLTSATALYGKSGNCAEHAAITATYSNPQSAERIHVITAEVPFGHVWAERRDADGVARSHDIIQDSWLKGPPVLRENARFANSAQPDEQHAVANDPRVHAAIEEMASRLGNSAEAKKVFSEGMDMSPDEISTERTGAFEPMSSMSDRFNANARARFAKQQESPRGKLLGDIQASGVGRQFGLPLASATHRENLDQIHTQLKTMNLVGNSSASSMSKERTKGLPSGPKGLPSGPRPKGSSSKS